MPLERSCNSSQPVVAARHDCAVAVLAVAVAVAIAVALAVAVAVAALVPFPFLLLLLRPVMSDVVVAAAIAFAVALAVGAPIRSGGRAGSNRALAVDMDVRRFPAGPRWRVGKFPVRTRTGSLIAGARLGACFFAYVSLHEQRK